MIDRQRGKATHITAVCGYPSKGIDTFLRLARAFPEERFLLAGDIETDISLAYRRVLRSQSNIELPGRLTTAELLSSARVILVPSRWPEPFGRIAVEAMANGIPVLASEVGGLAEILDGAPMGVSDFTDTASWERRLSDLLASDDLCREYGKRGRELAARFLAPTTTERFASTLESLASSGRKNSGSAPLIVFEGEDGPVESCFLVNRHWRRILDHLGFEARGSSPEAFELPDVVVHHDYTRNFLDFRLPDTGKLVAVRTWDFGPFPPELTARVNRHYDQLWVHTRWNEEQALAGGIDKALVRVVPHGIDPEVFRPDGPAFSIPGGRSFNFLFVGGTVIRKGIDILLAAYGRAFSPDDDVCLVIKDSTHNVFFAGQTFDEEIRRMAADPAAPAIAYLDGQLPEQDLAALYRTCDVAAFPYRAEGFVLPILEAMASGTPAIVPNIGPSVDYCTDDTSYMVPARRIRLPVNRRMRLSLGFDYEITGVDFPEIPIDTLAEHLRRVYEETPERRRRKAETGVATAHGSHTWRHAATHVEACLTELLDKTPPHRLEPTRTEACRDYRRRQVAIRLSRGPKEPPPV
jgi:glycosyltransferase involved in cell wall biosynthesis